MHGKIRHTRVFASLLGAGLLFPSLVLAQTSRALNAPPADVAGFLDASVTRANYTGQDWVETAKSMAGAARLHAHDGGDAEDLFAAGSAFYLGGRPVEARRALVQAARSFLGAGRPDQAARAYLAAAAVALQINDGDAAREALDHAERLAASSKLTPEQRRTILFQLRQLSSAHADD